MTNIVKTREIKDYAFIDKSGAKLRDSHAEKNTGKAYGFFYCDAPKEAIAAELPKIRELVNTPSNLELTLTECTGRMGGDLFLNYYAKLAKSEGINYVIEARQANSTNKAVAGELSAVLNQAYQSPLYREGEPFRGQIVYDDGKVWQALE